MPRHAEQKIIDGTWIQAGKPMPLILTGEWLEF
jgi:hypothetical protein